MKFFFLPLFALIVLLQSAFSQILPLKEFETQDVVVSYSNMQVDQKIYYPSVIHLSLNKELNLHVYGEFSQYSNNSSISKEFIEFQFNHLEALQASDLPYNVPQDDSDVQADLQANADSILTTVSRNISTYIDSYNKGYDNAMSLSAYEDHWYPEKEGVVVLVYKATTPAKKHITVRQVIRVTPEEI